MDPSERPSPEIAFAIACLSTLWHPDVPLRSHLEAVDDWRFFLRLIHHHQVLPIVYRALTQAKLLPWVPAPIQQKLIKRSQLSTQHNLQLFAETLRLVEAFQQANIRAIPLKGVLLAAQLYDSKALRQVRDIDILIEPQSYPLVKTLLEQRGYQPEKQEAQTWSATYEQIYLHQQGEMNWWHEQRQVTVDIHLRLCRNPHALPIRFEAVWATAVPVSWPQGGHISTLSIDHQVLFLSVHGANHQWSKLLWLTDLALLTQRAARLNLDWQSVFVQAKNLGIERAIAQGLTLTQQLFGITIPPPWAQVCQTKSVQFPVAVALKAILQPVFEQPGTLTTPPLSLRQIYQELSYTMSLRQSWQYKFSCITRLLITAKDWQILRLPSYLWFLYIPLRPILYSYRWINHHFVNPIRDEV
jgi:hypothetical protein